MKNNNAFKVAGIVIVSATVSLAVSAAVPITAKVIARYVDSADMPLELIVQNNSRGSLAMTEVRALGNAKPPGSCAMDLGVTGTEWDNPADRTLGANEAFLVGESTCNGMHIKSNNGLLKLSTTSDTETLKTMVLQNGRLFFPETEDCGPEMTRPASGAVLCAAESGFYLATPAIVRQLLQ